MSPNNTGYSYQGPQHPALQGHNVQAFPPQQQQQGAVNNYGATRADYTQQQQRWPDYGVPPHQYAPSTQQIAGLTMGNPGVRSAGSRDSDIVVGVTSGSQTRTPAASSVPGRSSSASGFSGEGYDHYIGATTAAHVQSYQSQAPTTTTTTTAVGSQGSSQAVTENPRQNPGSTAFAGYDQFPMTSHVQNYQQSQPATTTVKMPQQYRTAGNAPQQQQQQPAEYFDYTPSPTTSAPNYTPLYQTTDTIRQSTQATSAPIYTPMYQTANPTPSSHEATSAQVYDGVYQTAEPQQQQRQQQTVQYQSPRTVSPVQQPITQPHQPQPSQFQAVNRPQQQQKYSTPPALAQHTQYENFSPTIAHRTPTPSSTQVSEASYSSYQTTPSQPQPQPQTHVTPSQLQSQQQPLVAPPQPQPQLLHRPPIPQSVPSQQPAPTPGPTLATQPAKQPKPKSKPRPRKTAQQQNDGGLRVRAWNAPATAPPEPQVLQEPSMPVIYRQALGNVGGAGNVGNVKGWVEDVPAPRIVGVDMMGASESVKTWNAPAMATPPAPRVVGVLGVVNQQAVTPQGKQEWPQSQVQAPQYHPQKQQQQCPREQLQQRPEPQPQHQHQHQQQQQQYPPEQLQQCHEPRPQYQPQHQHHEPEPQYTQAQTRAYQAPPQSAPPKYQLPASAPPQHTPQDAPPPQPQPKHDSPQPQPKSRAPSEPRPAPPLNKDLMEQQMKVMVERMRYYQAADPVTFQQVWDNVRKSGAVGGVITNGSAGGASSGGTIMVRDGSVGSAGDGGGERMAIMDAPRTTPQTVSEATGTSENQPQQPQQPTQTQPVLRSAVPAQPISAPVTVKTTPPQAASAPSPNPAPPAPQENGINIKTARAVSKYLIKTSGHCLSEEVTLELLDRIKSFPVLCDKLEAMGYQFHRGNFSRFLLAEVDGEEEEVVDKMDVNMAVDDGESRVLGEVEDDQEQILRELNEARNIASPPPEPVPEPAQVPAKPVVSPPQPEEPVKRGRGRPAKYVVTANELQTTSEPDTDALVAPKTPMAVTVTAVNSLPTPISTVPTALSLSSTDQPAPAALCNGDIQQPPSPENESPSPKPDYVLSQPNIPSHPTPQSVKVTQATPTTHAGEMKQFVAPSQVYRPPTPPRLIIDLESPSPPQLQTENVAADVEMPDVEAPGAKRLPQNMEGSPKSLVVKLRLNSKEPRNRNVPGVSPEGPQFSKGVMIDLTSSATPEPQMNRVPQPPATAPQFGESFRQREREWQYPGGRAPPKQPVLIPIPIPIPQSAPPKQNVAPNPVIEERPYNPIAKKNALLKLRYDPATIARDIMIATGRSPNVVRPLNAHLDPLQNNIGRVRLVGPDTDLETVRWDIIDPDPMGYGDDADNSDGGVGGMADDEDEGGGVGGLGFAVARAPVVSRNPTTMKGMGVVVPSPTPAGRVRGKGSVLRASVKDFENSGQGTTTVLNLNNTNGSGGRTPRRQSATNDNRSNENGSGNSSGGGSWGGFTVPAPRSNSRIESGLRNITTPNVPSRNFEVVIRSPSTSSIDRRRAEPPNAKNLKRKLDNSDKEKGSPAAKKANKLAEQGSASRVGRKAKAKNKRNIELKPSGFKVFKCRWKHCSAELHNFETLHRHVIKAHCKLADFGGYPCKWEGCSKSPSKEAKAALASKRGGPSTLNYTWDFDNAEKWEKHVVELHLDGVRNELGVGPSVGPYDREVVNSDVDYLSDSHGRRITPIARPAPSGYVFLPPPGYISASDPNRYIARVRILGAGMEGNESADLRENDDGEGIFTAVRRIVSAEDGALGVLGSESASTSVNEGMKEKPKDGDDSESQVPSDVGAFTVHDE